MLFSETKVNKVGPDEFSDAQAKEARYKSMCDSLAKLSIDAKKNLDQHKVDAIKKWFPDLYQQHLAMYHEAKDERNLFSYVLAATETNLIEENTKDNSLASEDLSIAEVKARVVACENLAHADNAKREASSIEAEEIMLSDESKDSSNSGLRKRLNVQHK